MDDYDQIIVVIEIETSQRGPVATEGWYRYNMTAYKLKVIKEQEYPTAPVVTRKEYERIHSRIGDLTEYPGSEYDTAVEALLQASRHLKRGNYDSVRIASRCPAIGEAIYSLRQWEKNGWKRTRGKKIAHVAKWQEIAERLGCSYDMISHDEIPQTRINNSAAGIL